MRVLSRLGTGVLDAIRGRFNAPSLQTLDSLPRVASLHDTGRASILGEQTEVAPSCGIDARDWLARRNITVSSARKESASDPALNRLAEYLGNHYDLLDGFYTTLKKRTMQRRPFTYPLSTATEREATCCRQFAQQLYACAYLSQYLFDPVHRLIRAEAATSGKVHNFITGDWFERAVKMQVCNLLLEARIPHDVLVNANIINESGNAYELDLLFLIDGQPLWLECKTGRFQDAISRIQQKRQMLGVPCAQTILVILDISEEDAAAASDAHGIVVTSHHELRQQIEGIISRFMTIH